MTDHNLQTVLQTIARYRLLDDGDRVLIALSGGPDSVALAHLLHRLRTRLHLDLTACYINHNLRPRAARREADFCRDFCRRYKMVFFYEKIDIPILATADKTGLEETARTYRYDILTRVANREECNKIAVGHHRDDRAETILYNLFRGAGRQGITGFAPRRDKIIRPLYHLTRSDIETYLKRRRLNYMTDASNYSREFTRNRLRHRILPLIEKDITPAAAENIVRFADLMAPEEEYLDRQVRELYRRIVTVTPGNKFNLDLTDFLGYDIWLKRRLIKRLLISAEVPNVTFADVERLVDLLEAGKSTRITVRDNLFADINENRMFVYRPGRTIQAMKVSPPGRYRLEYPRLTISLDFVDDITTRELSGNNPATALVDAREIRGELTVGSIKRGVRFHPYGRPGSKKIGDFLTDRKYPRPLRDELPVVYDDRGVVWLVGIEIDQRVRVRPETERVIRIEVAEDTHE